MQFILPPARSRLPVIGPIRNPWDWYLSMHQDYRRNWNSWPPGGGCHPPTTATPRLIAS